MLLARALHRRVAAAAEVLLQLVVAQQLRLAAAAAHEVAARDAQPEPEARERALAAAAAARLARALGRRLEELEHLGRVRDAEAARVEVARAVVEPRDEVLGRGVLLRLLAAHGRDRERRVAAREQPDARDAVGVGARDDGEPLRGAHVCQGEARSR